MKSLATVLMMMVAGAAVAAPPGGVHTLLTDPGSELSGGLYYVTKTTTIDSTEKAGQPGLKVASGKTVAIYIPSGVTLTVKGGKGEGQTGGGAGIEVPEGATLVVTGGGILNATGGNAGNGADGSRGADAEVQWNIENHGMWTGTGGNGGAGGGGAGAGIGGPGGKGGDGGAGGGWVYDQWYETFQSSGNKGSNGKDGGDRAGCGTVVFMGTLTVNPKSGDTAKAGNGVRGSNLAWLEDSYYYYGGWGGGGGGGGGAGAAAYWGAIGRGGCGGGGGGGGGSGCLTYIHLASSFIAHNGWGKGGVGGKGGFLWTSTLVHADSGGSGSSCYNTECKDMDGVSGIWGRWNNADYYQDATRGGDAGQGGTSSSVGVNVEKHDFVRTSSGVTVNNLDDGCFASRNETTHSQIKYTIKFSDPKKLLESGPGDKTVYLGMSTPSVNPSTTASEENAMAGWYDAQTGGTKYYDEKGNPMFATYTHYEGDLTLYPQVEAAALTPTGVKVNGREIGRDAAPAGCVFGVATRLSGAGPFTISGENLNGLVRFVIEGDQEVAITLDGLRLKNERKNIGLIDIPAGSSAKISLNGTANSLEATGESSTAIHCPSGASVWIKGGRNKDDRKIWGQNDWTVKDEPFHVDIDWTAKGETVDLVLKSGSGAAAIGGKKGEPCGDITIEECDLSLTPNNGVKADRVHEIGNGLLAEKDDKILGGHVTFLNIPALRCPIRSGVNDIDSLTLSRPRPHDEYGVPLMPVIIKDNSTDNWIMFFRPGMLNIWNNPTWLISVPRSGKSAKRMD